MSAPVPPVPHGEYEIRPDPQALTGSSNPEENSSSGVNYEPDPSKSLDVPPERLEIVRKITNLYDGSASEEDMMVYAEQATYDDPWSFADTRYKIAGQWYGIPKAFASLRTLATQIVSSTPTELIFKMKHEYTPRLVHFTKVVNSIVILTLDEQSKVKYHKEMWNEKDYSHEGLGKVMKTLNGDHLTKITQPPKNL